MSLRGRHLRGLWGIQPGIPPVSSQSYILQQLWHNGGAIVREKPKKTLSPTFSGCERRRWFNVNACPCLTNKRPPCGVLSFGYRQRSLKSPITMMRNPTCARFCSHIAARVGSGWLTACQTAHVHHRGVGNGCCCRQQATPLIKND